MQLAGQWIKGTNCVQEKSVLEWCVHVCSVVPTLVPGGCVWIPWAGGWADGYTFSLCALHSGLAVQAGQLPCFRLFSCVANTWGHIWERQHGILRKSGAGKPAGLTGAACLEGALSCLCMDRLVWNTSVSSLCVAVMQGVPSSGSHKQHPNSVPAGEKCCFCQLKTSGFSLISFCLWIFFFQNASAHGLLIWGFLPSHYLFSCCVTAGWCWLTGFCMLVVLFTRTLIYCIRAVKIWETIICLQSQRTKTFLTGKISLGPLQV